MIPNAYMWPFLIWLCWLEALTPRHSLPAPPPTLSPQKTRLQAKVRLVWVNQSPPPKSTRV